MASFNQGSMQQSGGGGGGMWTGVAAGAGGFGALQYVQQTNKKATIAEAVAIGNLGLSVLGGNQAQGYANQAMTYANSMTSGSNALVAGDTDKIRNSIQQLAQGIQAINPLGYLGLQTSTQPTTSASTAAPAQTQNLGGLVLIVLALVFFMR